MWPELSVQPDQQLRLQADRHTRNPRGQASDGHRVSIIVIMCSGMWMISASTSPRTARGVQCPPSQAPRHGNKTANEFSKNNFLFPRYAVLDKGTNYCNLRNLIDGAG